MLSQHNLHQISFGTTNVEALLLLSRDQAQYASLGLDEMLDRRGLKSEESS